MPTKKAPLSVVKGGKRPPVDEQQTPQDLEAEQATIGAMLMSQDTAKRHDTITRAAALVAPEYFYREPHRHIVTAIFDMFLAERPVDLITVAGELRDRGLHEEATPALLQECIENCPSAANIEAYAEQVRTKALERQQLALADRLKGAVFDGEARLALENVSVQMEELKGRFSAGRALQICTDLDLDALLGNIEWLWHDWVLRGFITALVAPQEAGKSNVCLDLCRRLLQGLPWPDGTPTGIDPRGPDGNGLRLLWIDTDAALGGFLQRITEWQLPRGRFIFPRDPLRDLRLDTPSDWEWIEAVVRQYKPPLIVIDALSGGHRAEEKSNDEMKEIMLRLHGLAQREKIAVVITHHLRKAAPGEPDWPISLDRVRGATAITQYSRSIIGLGTPNRAELDNRRMDSIKSNWGRKPQPLGYTLTNSGPAWGGAVPQPPRPRREVDRAKEFVLDVVSGEKMVLSDDLFAEAKDEGISERTVRRAIDKLKEEGLVKPLKEDGRQGRWFYTRADRMGSSAPAGSEPASDDSLA